MAVVRYQSLNRQRLGVTSTFLSERLQVCTVACTEVHKVDNQGKPETWEQVLFVEYLCAGVPALLDTVMGWLFYVLLENQGMWFSYPPKDSSTQYIPIVHAALNPMAKLILHRYSKCVKERVSLRTTPTAACKVPVRFLCAYRLTPAYLST